MAACPFANTQDNNVVEYNKAIILAGDAVFTPCDRPLEKFILMDPSMSHIAQYTGKTELETKEEYNNSIQYFAVRYGINIGAFEPKDGMRVAGDHKFYGYYINPDINCRPIFDKRSGNVTGKVEDSGFTLLVGEPGVVVNGTYGGAVGKYLTPGTMITYGYYRITYNEIKCVKIMHHRSQCPCIHSDNRTFYAFHNDVYDFDNRTWGVGYVTLRIDRLQDNKQKLSVRNVITFM